MLKYNIAKFLIMPKPTTFLDTIAGMNRKKISRKKHSTT